MSMFPGEFGFKMASDINSKKSGICGRSEVRRPFNSKEEFLWQ